MSTSNITSEVGGTEDSGIGSQDIELDTGNLLSRSYPESDAHIPAQLKPLSRSGTPLGVTSGRKKSAGSQFMPRSQTCSARSVRLVPEPTIALPNSIAKNGRAHTPTTYYGQVIPENLQVSRDRRGVLCFTHHTIIVNTFFQKNNWKKYISSLFIFNNQSYVADLFESP